MDTQNPNDQGLGLHAGRDMSLQILTYLNSLCSFGHWNLVGCWNPWMTICLQGLKTDQQIQF